MKKAILLIIVSGLWHKAPAQAAGCAGEYMYLGADQPFTLVPVVYYQTARNWYIEGRYNYEAVKTMSVYAGKVFQKKSAVSYSGGPVAGIVLGRFTGGSAGVNAEVDYKKLLFSSQFQYTFSIHDKTENFFYSWSDLSFALSDNIYSGISVQQTNLYHVKFRLEKGLFVKILLNKWSFPFYVFNPAAQQRYFVLGMTRDW